MRARSGARRPPINLFPSTVAPNGRSLRDGGRRGGGAGGGDDVPSDPEDDNRMARMFRDNVAPVDRGDEARAFLLDTINGHDGGMP